MKILIRTCLAVILQMLTVSSFTEGLLTVCPPNEEYRVCGPKCPPNCEILKDEICCEVVCVAGCFCKDGYMRFTENGECVPLQSCPSAGVLRFVNDEQQVYEGEKVFRIAVDRISGSHGRITVHWRLVFEGSISYPEYSGKTGIIEFLDGETRKIIEIPLVDDTIRGHDISFRLELYEASKKAQIALDHAFSFLTIKDDDMQPGYLELENHSYTVVEGEGKVEIFVVRKDGTDGKILAHYRTRSATALSGTDFETALGQLIFEEGETRKSFVIHINNDDIKENSKFFEVELFNQAPGDGTVNFRRTGLSQIASITITDDDMKPGNFEVESTNYVFPESAGIVRIPVLRNGGTDGQISVHFKTIVKSAKANIDFNPVEGVLEFAEGQSRNFIEVKILDDDLREPNKNFQILLFDPASGPGVINFRKNDFKETFILVTITDDDMKPGYFELEKESYTVTEGGALRVGIVRLGGTDGSLTIHVKTVAKSALATTNFIALDKEIIFAENEEKKYIDIPIVDNDIREPDKMFEIMLYDPVPGIGVINFRNSGKVMKSVVTIVDNDMRPGIFEIERSYEVFENVGKIRVKVLRTGGSDGEIHVKYKTVQKTALENVDYIPVFGELTFLEHETEKFIDVVIKDDSSREQTKEFHIHLFESTAGPGVINFRSLDSDKISIITIKDDDMTPGFLQFEKPLYEVLENSGTLRIGVVRVDGKDGLLKMHYKTVMRSSQLFREYNLEGVLEFKDGEEKQYIDLSIHDNNVKNSQLKFQVQLFDITPGEGVLNFRQMGTIISTIVAINDDDMNPGILEFLLPSYTFKENANKLMVCVERKDGADGLLRVKYKTVSGTAIAGKDFHPMTGELVFRDGETLQHLHLHFIDNKIRDVDRAFFIEIYDPSSEYDFITGRILGSIAKTTVTIIDDDINPGKFELQKPSYSVFENDKVIKVGVERVEGADGLVHVKYKTIPLTAVPSRDFVPIEGDLVFNDKETTKYIEIQIKDNEVFESSRTFEIQLLDLIDGNGGVNFRGFGSRRSSVITINDDDMKPGYLEMQTDTVTVNENIGIAKLVVIRRGGTDGIIKVKYRIISVSADLNKDYEIVPPVELVFQQLETEKTIHIKIVNDAEREQTETFRVELYDQSIPSNYRVFNYRNRASTLTTDVIILDDDTRPGYVEMVATRLTVWEDIGRVRVTVSRKDGTDGHLRVKYRTVDGTATSSFDYVFDMGELEFEEGESEQNISIKIVDDTMAESSEYFSVLLFDVRDEAGPVSGRSYNLKLLETQIVIMDNDRNSGSASMEKENITVNENAVTVQINVIRTGGSEGNLIVRYRTKDGTALSGADYILSSGEITFRNGEIRKSISVRLINDILKESAESFTVELLDISSGVQPRSLGALRSTNIIIIDDDKILGKFQFHQSRITVQESAFQVTLIVKRFGGSDGSITLRWTARDITATSGLDYNPTQGLIPFADGQMEQSVSIAIIDDKTREEDEKFIVALHGPSNTDVLGAVNTVTVTIADDDDYTAISDNLIEVNFNPTTYIIRRNQRIVKLHIFRTGDLEPLSVYLTTNDGTAKGGEDYRKMRGRVEFYAGERSITVTVRTYNQPRIGDNKIFYYEIFAPSRGIVGRNKTATVIIENDSSVRLNGRNSPEEGSVIGGDGQISSFDGSSLTAVNQFKNTQLTSQQLPQIPNFGTGQQIKTIAEKITIFFVNPTITVKRSEGKVKVEIGRSGDFNIPLTVFFETRDGTAKAGIDYRATKGDISFLKNEIQLGVQVILTDFILKEKEDKFFFIDISQPSLGIVVPSLGRLRVVIVNDITAADSSVEKVSSSFSESSFSFRSRVNGGSPPGDDTPWVNHQVNVTQQSHIPPPPPHSTKHENCPVGMTFRRCAPACPKTCENMDDPEPCHNKCVDACFCEDGFVKESSISNKCILPEDCIGSRSKTKIVGKLAAGAGLLGLGGLLPALGR